MADLLQGQFCNPIRIIGFNVAEGWCRDDQKTLPTSCRSDA
jgi:hypothetical protein